MLFRDIMPHPRMALAPGTRLGVHEVASPLGAGGPGDVYRAHDTKLDRDVAIKVLPDLFAADPERLTRFEREARTLAAFNHQNIAQVHGVIEQPPALVMELVDGEDLATRIARGPTPLERIPPPFWRWPRITERRATAASARRGRYRPARPSPQNSFCTAALEDPGAAR
jgi:serine/threonine protein kinase